MGNNSKSTEQLSETKKDRIDLNHPRFRKSSECPPETDSAIEISISNFKRLDAWQIQLQGLTGYEEVKDNNMVSHIYFRDQKSLDMYLGNMLSLKNICLLNIYNTLEVKIEQTPFCISVHQELLSKGNPLNQKEIKEDIKKTMDLLIFVAKTVKNCHNLYFTPSDLVESNNEYYLRGFDYKQGSFRTLIIGFMAWIFGEHEHFEECYEEQTIVSIYGDLDIYLKEIYSNLKGDKIDDAEIYKYLLKTKHKYRYMMGNFDSIFSCLKIKKSKYELKTYRQWILAKKNNEAYMYNIQDQHICQGRIIRKQRKINIQHTHLMFNSEDFQLVFFLQGTKNIVKTTQFQIQDCFTVSDIEIKHKFPMRMRNPFMFKKDQHLYLFEQMAFKFNIQENKLYQLSRKINDCLCFVESHDFEYLIIKLSIDIFKNGILIYAADVNEVLMPSGNPSMVGEIQSIKVDIRHVQFCVEVYKGMFLMLASRNLWILDINFMCFFSFTSIERLRDYWRNKSQSQQKQYVFEIINQPFSANWLSHHHGINVSIQDDYIHLIGTVMNKFYYLKYQCIYEAGLLKLVHYQPLFSEQSVQTPTKSLMVCEPDWKHRFHVYHDYSDFLKNIDWIHYDPSFLIVNSIETSVNKTFTEICITTEPIIQNLKDLIQENKKLERTWNNEEISMALYKIYTIFHDLTKRNIAHKNFNVNNLWINASRQLKLSGWSEPPKNWHISDYKDFLLTCLNIITQNIYDKITDKVIEKHQRQLSHFPILLEKMQVSLKNKQVEKKSDLDKNMHGIQQCLNKSLYKLFEGYTQNNFIFSYEFNTPRFSMLDITLGKIKKMNAILQGNSHTQQFTFKNSDQYVWSEEQSTLYIFTISYQMYSLKINTIDLKEENLQLEQFQYLPNNIIDCSFINTPNGLYAFGGIVRHSKKKILFNKNIYHFDREKLTWTPIAEFNEPRIQPRLILSENKQYIISMGGQHKIPNSKLEVIIFNIKTNKLEKMVDQGFKNPLKKLNDRQFMKIFQISQRYNLFMIWTISNTVFNVKIFSSMVCGFQLKLQGKIYLDEGSQLPQTAFSFADGGLHFLRPYGKYTKISIGKLQAVTVSHKTVYST